MDLPVNTFKRALTEGRSQIGLWCSLAHHYSLEAVAGAGFVILARGADQLASRFLGKDGQVVAVPG